MHYLQYFIIQSDLQNKNKSLAFIYTSRSLSLEITNMKKIKLLNITFKNSIDCIYFEKPDYCILPDYTSWKAKA